FRERWSVPPTASRPTFRERWAPRSTRGGSGASETFRERWPSRTGMAPFPSDEQVREDEAVALDDLAASHRYGTAEHRPVVGEGVELPALAASVHAGRQLGEQGRVDLPACKALRHLLRVHAGQARPQARRHHLARQRAVGTPQIGNSGLTPVPASWVSR